MLLELCLSGAGNSPLETFYSRISSPCRTSTIPTSRLRYVRISQEFVDWEAAQFIAKCQDLTEVELRVHRWEPDVVFSLSTLTLISLHGEYWKHGPVTNLVYSSFDRFNLSNLRAPNYPCYGHLYHL